MAASKKPERDADTDCEIAVCEDWMHNLVVDGLQLFVMMALPGTPPEETIDFTVGVWCQALMEVNKDWDEALDTPRLRKAFNKLLPEIKSWPSPGQLLTVLPRRPKPKALAPRKITDLTDEERQFNLGKIRELKEQIKELEKKMSMPKGKDMPELLADVEKKKQRK